MAGIGSVTIGIVARAGRVWKSEKEISEVEHLKKSCADLCKDYRGMIYNYSHGVDPVYEEHISASSNGLVHACLAANNNGHHLYLRPDDVWLAAERSFGRA
jgi:hypothetical protein